MTHILARGAFSIEPLGKALRAQTNSTGFSESLAPLPARLQPGVGGRPLWCALRTQVGHRVMSEKGQTRTFRTESAESGLQPLPDISKLAAAPPQLPRKVQVP
jgi:hypothetical protein